MSLLIKALDKAQEAKAQEAKAQDKRTRDVNADYSPKRKPSTLDNDVLSPADNATSAKLAAVNALEMELSPVSKAGIGASQLDDPEIQGGDDFQINSPSKLSQPASVNGDGKTNKTFKAAKAPKAYENSVSTAANVFAAKRIESNSQNAILALVAAIGLCLLLAAGGYYYLFMDNENDFVLAKRPAMPAPLPVNPASSAQVMAESQTTDLSLKMESTQPDVVQQSGPASASPSVVALTNEAASQQTVQAEYSIRKPIKPSIFSDESLTRNKVRIEKPSSDDAMPMASNSSKTLEVGAIASKSASIQVSRSRPESAVNSVLMDAYNAYNAGNDAEASKLYRQVLQRDVRNADALLGLGAIAQRQGRIADANGWYAKVLEVEPRNALANAAVLDNQPQNDMANNESRIKNMLAKNPDDANLYAMLGNYYADLNQWAAAQQAYFDAYRLNASADNAFNLAVSLDQLNKPKLALPYYQSALQLAQTGGSSIDTSALQARIAAIR